ncbi:NEDD8 ultimate buster 1 isoform X1 [Arachis ipaensis]|uniref:NEDD8 ultimate buster 1 isoform X1 n=1 Tax=Arachis ipaensis TaxID=130454 RepID=UPI0007AEECDB|nr:NEDD8 ultimate buster 1 isoform X1 [Arachis ipaensis]XP_025636754.1 NEDD8 ultimate buster 1 isoform X1 [Arachis hypogaea]
MAKLKIGGTWAGVLEDVDLDSWTVPKLREEVARRSNCSPDSISLICAGKILKDDDATGGHGGNGNLAQVGVKNNSKILASRVSPQEGNLLRQEIMAEEERSRRLSRVRAAATALAERHADGSLPVEDFNIEVEDQSGKKVRLGSETDQRAVMMGLMLHAKGKRLIKQGNYKDALEVLSMGEESFSLCDPKVIELIDNVPILQIDMVWCYFMIRDIRWLSDAGKRLEMARVGIERAHGKDSFRLRLLQGGRYPELAFLHRHLRLELLEGVVTYHSGQLDKSRKALDSAKAKFNQLQVPDEALSFLMSMGYKERDAKRALRMNNQDVGSAIDFLAEETTKKLQKQEEDIRRRTEIREQKRYGMTPLKKAVDLERLKELVSIGFDKELAAEALRRNENDTQKALDDLTNPETNSALQVHIESRKRKRQKQATETQIEKIVHMGFERSRVVAAFEVGGTLEEVIQRLTALPEADHAAEAIQTAAPDGSASSSAPLPHNVSEMLEQINDVEDPSDLSKAEERDVEMEDELSAVIVKTDALADYDIEVNIEGEAITEYLALIEAAGSSGKMALSRYNK